MSRDGQHLSEVSPGSNSLRKEPARSVFRTSFRTTTEQCASHSSAVVGIASRLVNRDAALPWNPIAGQDTSEMLSGTRGMPYSLIDPSGPGTAAAAACQPCPTFFAPMRYQMPVVNPSQPMYANQLQQFVVFHQSAGPSFATLVPAHGPQRVPTGYRTSVQSPMFFQYPLHHLTGVPGEPVSRMPIRTLLSSSRTSVTHPVARSAAQNPLENDLFCPQSPLPLVVAPAFDFDDPQRDRPQDLSQRPSNQPVVNCPSATCHDSVRSLPVQPKGEPPSTDTLPSSEMGRAADAWASVQSDGQTDAWTVLELVKAKRIQRDCAVVKAQSVLANLPLPYREDCLLAQIQAVPEDVLQSVGLVVAPVSTIENDSSEVPIDAVDVDQSALFSFAQHLSGGSTCRLPVEEDGPAENMLRAVGLVPRELPARRRESLFARRRKRKPRAQNISLEIEVSQLEEAFQPQSDVPLCSGDRAHLKRQLDESLVDLTGQMETLKRKMHAVNRLVREEEVCDDSDVSALLRELQTIMVE